MQDGNQNQSNGRKTGDIVEVETQAGVIKYKVLEIERSN